MNKPICIVTGAGGDIGSQIAKRLSSNYSIALIGRTQSSLEKILLGLNEGNHNIYPCDISNNDSITQAIKGIVEKQGNPSVLINGAAAFGEPKKLHEYTNEEIDEIIKTNLGGTSKITKEVLPYMIKNGGGNIITIGSTCYNGPYPKRLLYAATKRALQSFTETNAVDYEKENIKSNYIFPGPTEGERVDDIITKRAIESKKKLDSMREKYGKINGGELLKVENTVDAIQMVLEGNLSVENGSTLGIDNFGIFDESQPMFTSKNGKEHEFIDDKKRKYMFLWKEISPKIHNKKQRTQLIEFFHKTLKISKYAAIGLLIILAGKSMNVNQEAENLLSDFKERKYNEKDFNHEFKRLCREEYGIYDPQKLLNKQTEKQEWEIGDLYIEIGKHALENIKKYKKQGYTITGIDIDQELDI